MYVFEESRIRFLFDSKSWASLLRFDTSSDYKALEKALDGSKAVDFIGQHHTHGYAFIEVKNFRGYRIENKQRQSSKDLHRELAQKVRDTFACALASSARSDSQRPFWQGLVRHFAKKGDVHIILWLEEDPIISKSDQKVKGDRRIVNTSVKRDHLKSFFRWCHAKVYIFSSADCPADWAIKPEFLPDKA